MWAQRKSIETKGHSEPHETAFRSPNLRPASECEDVAGAQSPARSLQAGLAEALAPREERFSRREVYSAIIVFCFAVWWALFLALGALF